jgi:tight adherence protein B
MSVSDHRIGGRGLRTRAAATVATVLCAILAAPALGAAAPGVRVSEGGGAVFPARALVLSVHGVNRLQPRQVHISENGRLVQGAAVTPLANAGSHDFGVVIAIDTGPTMRGQPLERAMAAARALAAERPQNQALGVVMFDEHASVVLPLTTNAQAIANALSGTPPVGHGAYIYNALNTSVAQLTQARIAAGAVILLSDGASSGGVPLPGHNLTASSVGATAAAAHAHIYTVGLRDQAFTPERMSLLARVGGGQFIEATSAQLSNVFMQIESGLTSAYVVHYRSDAPAGHSVQVTVAVDGVPGSALLTYNTPAATPITTHARPKPGHSFWSSSGAAVVVGCAIAALLALALLVLVGPHLDRGRLRRRVGEFTASGATDEDALVQVLGPARQSPLPRLERLLAGREWWERFKLEVELAQIRRAPVELLALTAIGTLALAVLVGVALHAAAASALVVVFVPLALRSRVRMKLRKQRQLFAEQLPSHLQELASAMRAGHSLVSGITAMAAAAPEPSHTEWQRVAADEKLGMPLQDAMKPLGERMSSDDVGQVALVAGLHQRTGGNMAEVLERVADSVRERGELRRELDALTAQARLSRYIVTALPLVVAGAIALLNPSYMHPLLHTGTGVALLCICAVLLVIASLVMRSITDVKV